MVPPRMRDDTLASCYNRHGGDVVGAKCRKIFKIGKPFEKKLQASLTAAKSKKAD